MPNDNSVKPKPNPPVPNPPVPNPDGKPHEPIDPPTPEPTQLKTALANCGLIVPSDIAESDLLRGINVLCQFMRPDTERSSVRGALQQFALLPHSHIDGLDVEMARHIDNALRSNVRNG